MIIKDKICRGIGSNKKICFDEFIRAAEFDAYFPTKKFKTEEARKRDCAFSIYYQFVKIFTTDAVNQWFEITDGIFTSKLDPVWFAEHRVYEIPVKAGTILGKSFYNFSVLSTVLVKAWSLWHK